MQEEAALVSGGKNRLAAGRGTEPKFGREVAIAVTVVVVWMPLIWATGALQATSRFVLAHVD